MHGHTFTTNLVKTWWSTGSYLVTEGIIYRSFLCLCSRTTSVLQCVLSLNNKIISSEACQPSAASGIYVLSLSHICGRIVVCSVSQPSWNLFTKRNSSWLWATAFHICLFFNPFVYPLLITAPSGWNPHFGYITRSKHMWVGEIVGDFFGKYFEKFWSPNSSASLRSLLSLKTSLPC